MLALALALALTLALALALALALGAVFIHVFILGLNGGKILLPMQKHPQALSEHLIITHNFNASSLLFIFTFETIPN